MESTRISLPKLIYFEINNFSLYDVSEHKITIDFMKPAACIIGANGLGKSTMLNCINYALTGMINQPGRKVRSIFEYYRQNKYYNEYFEGRIQEKDRDIANIKIVFSIKDCKITVVRGFYPDNSVIHFECSNDKYDRYEDAVVSLMGLKNFDQFAFLQVKVLTFDEERECLFWDPNLLTSTLYLTMNLSPEIAEKADIIQSNVQKSNSRIRNLQFEINKLNKRIETLTSELIEKPQSDTNQELSDTELKEKHEMLIEGLEKAENDYSLARSEYDFLISVISELTAKQHLVKSEYDNLYKTLFNSNSAVDLRNSPIISELLHGNCIVCDTKGTDIWKASEEKILMNKCPLCESEILHDNHNHDEIMLRLEEVDNNLQQINAALEEHILKSARLRGLMESSSNYIEKTKLEVMKIEQSSTYMIINDGEDSGDIRIRERIESLRRAALEVEIDKNDQIVLRDNLMDEASDLHKLLTNSYNDARKHFLPKFRTLARAFTGLNVDIILNEVIVDAKKMLAFSLSMEESGRKYDHQLSESQRFFLDIALRMAIVDYIADNNYEGCMLIDTPEGSLDIAYEANAGEMFAEFINRQHQLIITANLNSSGLVKTFANKSGSARFNLINIIKWANLSTVQSERMPLFTEALKDIEAAMKSGEDNR
ncbi:AAA family ATPase [Paenibacillus arenosi]|uniref:Nuclease SbcCD subunit C n=1 Tax=Paenibacillus arenosi TaxID=2774142 RepID=A0ABR9AZZ3_9BACL|nr:AAA family ATPase [Paenibacillus arenosi]MBD8498516.1 AAA family ATPase [Paenibacillus arenosi]